MKKERPLWTLFLWGCYGSAILFMRSFILIIFLL